SAAKAAASSSSADISAEAESDPASATDGLVVAPGVTRVAGIFGNSAAPARTQFLTISFCSAVIGPHLASSGGMVPSSIDSQMFDASRSPGLSNSFFVSLIIAGTSKIVLNFLTFLARGEWQSAHLASKIARTLSARSALGPAGAAGAPAGASA